MMINAIPIDILVRSLLRTVTAFHGPITEVKPRVTRNDHGTGPWRLVVQFNKVGALSGAMHLLHGMPREQLEVLALRMMDIAQDDRLRHSG